MYTICLQVPVEASRTRPLATLELQLQAFVSHLIWVLNPGSLAARAKSVFYY